MSIVIKNFHKVKKKKEKKKKKKKRKVDERRLDRVIVEILCLFVYLFL